MTLPLFEGQRGAEAGRREGDLYPTDIRVCRAVCRALVKMGYLRHRTRIVEPHLGTGNWLRALVEVGVESGQCYDITLSDIDSSASGFALAHAMQAEGHRLRLAHAPDRVRIHLAPCGDWLDPSHRDRVREHGPFDLCLGNPPYSIVEPGQTRGTVVAHLHAQACRVEATVTCLVLPRSLWTASRDPGRVNWGATDPPAYELHLGPPRPSFTGDGGTGNAEYSAAIWFQSPVSGRQPHTMSDGWTLSRLLSWSDS